MTKNEQQCRAMPEWRYWGSSAPAERTREPLKAEIPSSDSSSGKTATIRLYDPIDSYGGFWGVSAKEFVFALDEMGDGVEQINLHINSPGGDVFEGIAILNALRNHPANVTAIVDGLAASSAGFIAAGANELIMGRNTQIMVHDAWGLVIGNAADMEKFSQQLNKLSDNIASVYVEKAGGTLTEWRNAMLDETWYSAEEAVQAGLADKVAAKSKNEGNKSASNRFDLSIFAHAGRGNAPAPYMPVNLGSETPAEPSVTQPNTTKEADAMSDTENEGLRQRLGLAKDADEATVLAKVDELLDQATAPTPPAVPAPPVAPLVPEGSVIVSNDVLDELRIAASAGQEARSIQLREERDRTISAAVREGHIAPARREFWTAKWDADPEGVKAKVDELTKSGPIFPVGEPSGYVGAAETIDDEDKLFNKFFGNPETAGV